MFLIGPRPYLLGEAFIPLTSVRQYWTKSIPNGGAWTLKFLLVNYPRTVVARVQSTPDLSYRLFDAEGRAYQVNPVSLPMVTSPSGAFGLNATNLINVKYPGGSSVRLEINGRLAGVGPDSVSITLFGIRSMEMKGG